MKTIKLTNDKDEMMVSDEDYKLLNIFSWTAWGDKSSTYARTRVSQVHIKVLDLINYKFNFEYRDTITPPDLILGKHKFPYVIDHIDRNTLNNQRSNLRLATFQQNAANRSLTKNKYIKGVHSKRGNHFAVMQGTILGKFKTIRDAAICYDKAVIAFYGEFACTNFPREEYEKCSVHP